MSIVQHWSVKTCRYVSPGSFERYVVVVVIVVATIRHPLTRVTGSLTCCLLLLLLCCWQARIMAEAEGRIKESRENQDLIREQLKLKGEQDRLRVKQAIDATFEHLGSGISAFLGDRQRITTTVLSLTALAAGVYVGTWLVYGCSAWRLPHSHRNTCVLCARPQVRHTGGCACSRALH